MELICESVNKNTNDTYTYVYTNIFKQKRQNLLFVEK